MKIIHFSDPHAGGGAENWRVFFDKRWVGVFNYRFRRRCQHDLSRLRSAVDYILANRPDVAVCTGDLTSTSQPGEFDRVLEILKPLRNSSVPLLYVPGNHDRYVDAPECVAAVRTAVEYLSRGDYGLADLPLMREYCGVEFGLLNCCRPSNLVCSWGFMTKADSARVEAWCARPKRSPRVLLSHYPLHCAMIARLWCSACWAPILAE